MDMSWIRSLEVRVPLRSRHSLSQKSWHFPKNTRSCVANECCCPSTVNISNVNFISKISIPPEPVFNNMGQQISGPDSSIEHSAWIRRLGVPVPLRSRHFLSQNFDTFPRTPVCVSKMNAVALAQVTFQMLTLLQKYIYIHTAEFLLFNVYQYSIMINLLLVLICSSNSPVKFTDIYFYTALAFIKFCYSYLRHTTMPELDASVTFDISITTTVC